MFTIEGFKLFVLQDYFEVMGLHRKFTIDLADLTKRFRGIQSTLHPDKFSNKYVIEYFIRWKIHFS